MAGVLIQLIEVALPWCFASLGEFCFVDLKHGDIMGLGFVVEFQSFDNAVPGRSLFFFARASFGDRFVGRHAVATKERFVPIERSDCSRCTWLVCHHRCGGGYWRVWA